MPNFDPSQVLPEEQTEQITTPVSMPNQFGGVVTAAPVDPVAQAAAAQAAQAQQADQLAAQGAFQAHAAGAPVASNAPPAAIPIPPPILDQPLPQMAPAAQAEFQGAPVAPPVPVVAPAPVAAHGGPAAAPAPPPPADTAPGSPERGALNTEAQGNLEAQTGLKAEQARQASTDAALVAAQRVQDEQDIAKAQEKGAQFVQQAQNHFDERQKAYQDALEEDKTHTVFTGKSTFNKAASWLGMALGAIGAGFSAAGGHPTGNLAVGQMNKEIEDDIGKQRSHIADMKDATAMSLTGLKNADDARQSLLHDLLAKQGAAYASLESQARANAAGFGVKAADLEGSDLMTTLKQGQLKAKTDLERQAQQDYLTRLKTNAGVAKDYAEAGEAKAGAELKRAQATGAVGFPGATVNVNGAPGGPGVPFPGSKLDKAIMSAYVNPARKDAAKDNARVTMLTGLNEAIKDPNLTYGQAKQILINGFTAAGGNPGGRIAVADIHEVLPGMQSTLERFVSELDQGADNRVSDEFRKTVAASVGPDHETLDGRPRAESRDSLKKTLSALPPAAAQEHYAWAPSTPNCRPPRARPTR